MLLAKTIWLQSGDDESITIDISTECVPVDLSQNYVYWELRQTLNSEAVISKTNFGTELLPPGTTPDVIVDNVNNSVTIYLGEYETVELLGEYVQYLYLRNRITSKKTSVLYGTVGFLENPDSAYDSVTYTTPELVAKQLRMTNGDGSNLIFTEDTDPPRSLVVEYIRQAEVHIDRETRNSWKSNQITDEMHDIGFPLAGMPLRDVVVSLRKSNILPWDPDEGDSLFVMEGNRWVEYTNEAIELDGNSWWIDYKIGQIHFNDFWPWFFSGSNKVRVNYRWGSTEEAPDDIKEACTKTVAIRLLQSEFNKIMLYNRSSNPINWNNIIQYWEKDIKAILATRRRKILSVVTR